MYNHRINTLSNVNNELKIRIKRDIEAKKYIFQSPMPKQQQHKYPMYKPSSIKALDKSLPPTYHKHQHSVSSQRQPSISNHKTPYKFNNKLPNFTDKPVIFVTSPGETHKIISFNPINDLNFHYPKISSPAAVRKPNLVFEPLNINRQANLTRLPLTKINKRYSSVRNPARTTENSVCMTDTSRKNSSDNLALPVNIDILSPLDGVSSSFLTQINPVETSNYSLTENSYEESYNLIDKTAFHLKKCTLQPLIVRDSLQQIQSSKRLINRNILAARPLKYNPKLHLQKITEKTDRANRSLLQKGK